MAVAMNAMHCKLTADRHPVTVSHFPFYLRGPQNSFLLNLSKIHQSAAELQRFKQWLHLKQDAQLSQRDRAAEYISFGRKCTGRLELRDNILLIL